MDDTTRAASRAALLASAGRVLAGVLLGLAPLWLADQLARDGRVRTDGLLDRIVLSQLGSYQAERGGRGIRAGSCIALEGWAETPVTLSLGVVAVHQERPMLLRLNDQPSLTLTPTRQPGTYAFTASTDAHGRLQVCFDTADGEHPGARLTAVAMHHERRGAVPKGRVFRYALLGGCLAFLMRRRRPKVVLLAVLGSAAVAALAIGLARLQLLPVLLPLFGWLGLLCAWLGLAELTAWATKIPVGHARWLVPAVALRLALIVSPAFFSIDAGFQAYNTQRFLRNQVVDSEAPGLQRVPYPPAFYAILATVMSPDRTARDEEIARMAMGLLEASAPFLVLAILRAAGASRTAAGAGAVTMAVMPEGLLVLAKGIGANIFGAYVCLLLVLAVLRKASSPVLGALLALSLLSHAPSAATTIALLGLWSLAEYRAGALSLRDLVKRALALFVAAGVAWLAYYRETTLVLDKPGVTIKDPAFFYVRWYRVGKTAQDLLLKFGGAPLVLAFLGLRARALASAPALKTLLRSWFVVGAAVGVVAVVSVFPLRFEYFLLPAVALAAGVGAGRLEGRRGRILVHAAFGVSLLIQAAIGWFHLHGKFKIIAVIMESPSWPFPFAR